MQIQGRWDKPIVKTKGAAIGLAITFMAISVIFFHDAYEVRGEDRPFILKIVGFPQL